MIRTIVKLLIAAAIINAAARAGMAAWTYYRLRDEAQQLMRFGTRVTTAELANEIREEAMSLGVTLEPENLEVRRDGDRTLVDASYVQPVEFFPTFTYPLEMSFSLETFAVNVGR